MDNELIPEATWWKRHWKWTIPLSAFILMGIGILLMFSEVAAEKNEREHGIAFDHEKWNTRIDDNFVYRNKMIKDLITSETLRRLNKDEVISMLGQPDRIDNAYLFYRIDQKRIGLFPLHVTTLVIKLSIDGTPNKVMIHE